MSESYNKKLLAENLSAKLDVTKKQATEFIDAFLEEVTSALASGNKVDLSGFGKFEVKERPAREGFNPQTKEKIQVAASNKVAFKPAKSLKDSVQ